MKLCATTVSERGKSVQKTANECIQIHLRGEQDKKTFKSPSLGFIQFKIDKDLNTGDEYYRVSYQFSIHSPRVELKTLLKESAFKLKCVHDWDNYGKCTICGHWDIEGERI